MAAKKIKSDQDAIKYFDGVVTRSSASGYIYVNNIALFKTKDDKSMLIVPEDKLWNEIVSRPDYIREIDLNNKEESDFRGIFKFADDLNEGWIDLDTNILSAGKVMKISYKSIEYEIPINKDLLPLRLTKDEWNNVTYRIFIDPLTLVIRKKFETGIEGFDFNMLMCYRVL